MTQDTQLDSNMMRSEERGVTEFILVLHFRGNSAEE